MKKHILCVPVIAVVLAAVAELSPAQTPVGTAFTYQGQLKQGGLPVTQTADFQFRLWDALATPPGVQIGTALSFDNVTVTNGLFTAPLDFGAGAFTGEARWLEISVHSPAGSGGYVTLTPRQELTATPYALFSAAPWVRGGGDAIFYNAGNVDIGATSPWCPLQVETTGDMAICGMALGPSKGDRTNRIGVYGEGTTIGVRGVAYQYDAFEHYGMWGTAGNQGTNYGVRGEGSGNGTNYGILEEATGSGMNFGVQGKASGYTSGFIPEYGVWGQAIGYRSNSDNYGLFGLAQNAGNNYGVSGSAETIGAVENAGVCAAASGATNNYGVYGIASGGVTNWAGYFDGRGYFSGNVGIGLYDPSQKLDVSGTARLRSMPTGTGTTVVADTNGVLQKQSSSRRYKEDIANLSTNGAAVLNLRPVGFEWCSSGQRDIGLIAEEVAGVLPDLVICDPDGQPDAVKYDKVALYLLDVVKAQREQLAEQQNELTDLRTRLERIEAAIGGQATQQNGGVR